VKILRYVNQRGIIVENVRMINIINVLDPSKSHNIHIFGDSHSKCFFRDKFIQRENISIYNHYKSSVSMKGLTNEESKHGYGDFIIEKLDNINSDNNRNIIVLKFGQVDIEYNYYFKIFKKGETLTRVGFYSSIIRDYVSFVKDLSIRYSNLDFIVNGVNVPNMYDLQKYIKDNIGFDMDKIDYVSQFDNHILFNQILYNECEKEKLKYFDLTEETTSGKVLKNEFIGKDNHLSGAETGSFYNENTYSTFINKLISIV